jgi:hypothetical protein
MEDKIDYGEIVSRAWNFTWNNKFLWVLGLLTILGSESLINSDLFIGRDALFDPLLPDGPPVKWLRPFVSVETAVIIIGFIIIFLWLIHFAAQAGLITAVVTLSQNKPFHLKTVFAESRKYIWKLLGLNLLLFSLFYAIALINIFFLSETPLLTVSYWNNEFLTSETGTRLFDAGMLVSCVLIPLNLLCVASYPFAQRWLIIRHNGIMNSIQEGFFLLTRNAVRLLPLLIFLIIFGLTIGAILTGIGTILSFIFDLLGMDQVNPSEAPLWVRSIGLFIMLLFNSILYAFISTAMTLIFQDCIEFSKFGHEQQTVH